MTVIDSVEKVNNKSSHISDYYHSPSSCKCLTIALWSYSWLQFESKIAHILNYKFISQSCEWNVCVLRMNAYISRSIKRIWIRIIPLEVKLSKLFHVHRHFFKIIFVLNVMSIYPRIFSRFFPFGLEQYCSQTLSMKKCVAFPV